MPPSQQDNHTTNMHASIVIAIIIDIINIINILINIIIIVFKRHR